MFLLKINCSRDIKTLSLIFKWNSELLEARTLKLWSHYVMVTTWLHMVHCTWSLTAVDFINLDCVLVKGELPECSPTLNLEWRQVSPYRSTTRKFINSVRVWTQRYLIFEPEKFSNCTGNLKVILILQN